MSALKSVHLTPLWGCPAFPSHGGPWYSPSRKADPPPKGQGAEGTVVAVGHLNWSEKVEVSDDVCPLIERLWG